MRPLASIVVDESSTADIKLLFSSARQGRTFDLLSNHRRFNRSTATFTIVESAVLRISC